MEEIEEEEVQVSNDFKYQAYVANMHDEFKKGKPMTKYIRLVLQYLDRGLLSPQSKVLDEEHKAFVRDKVIGIEVAELCLTRKVMKKPCKTIKEFELVRRYITSVIKLVIQYMPLENVQLIRVFYNDMCFRRYAYYLNALPEIINHCRKTTFEVGKKKIDVSVLKSKTPAEGEFLLLYHLDQFKMFGGLDAVMKKLKGEVPLESLFSNIFFVFCG